MNLAERRAISEFETSQIPSIKTRIAQAVGFEVPLDIHWETLAAPGEARLYAESWPQIYFEPLIAGLETVARDQMGKDALKEGLKKIVVQNTSGRYYSDGWVVLEDGVLTLDHDPMTNASDGADREKTLVDLLESKL